MSSPWDSMFSSNPSEKKSKASALISKHKPQNFKQSLDSTHHLPAWRGASRHWLSWERWASPPGRPWFPPFLLHSRSAAPETDKPTGAVTKTKTPRWTTQRPRAGLAFHLEQELILGDSLHGFDQIGGDRVGKPVPLLDLLHAGRAVMWSDVHQRGACGVVLAVRGDTHVKVVASMLQDELGGVWFVLAIVHIHLEFVRLDKQTQTVKGGEKPTVPELTREVKRPLQFKSHVPMWQNNVQHLLVAAHIFLILSGRCCREKHEKSGSGSTSSGSASFLTASYLWWNSKRSCMFPNMMCSLLMMPGGISSTPLVISHKYVCIERRRRNGDLLTRFFFFFFFFLFVKSQQLPHLHPYTPSGLARTPSLSESALPWWIWRCTRTTEENYIHLSGLNISELLNFYNLWVKRKWKRTLFGVLTCVSLRLIRERRLAAWPPTLEPWLGWCPTGGLYSAREQFKTLMNKVTPRERLWPVNAIWLCTDCLVGVWGYPQSLLQAAAVLVHAQREVSVAFVHCRHPLFDLSGVTVAFLTEAISELD